MIVAASLICASSMVRGGANLYRRHRASPEGRPQGWGENVGSDRWVVAGAAFLKVTMGQQTPNLRHTNAQPSSVRGVHVPDDVVVGRLGEQAVVLKAHAHVPGLLSGNTAQQHTWVTAPERHVRHDSATIYTSSDSPMHCGSGRCRKVNAQRRHPSA